MTINPTDKAITVEPLDHEKLDAAARHLKAFIDKTQGKARHFKPGFDKANALKRHLEHARLYIVEAQNRIAELEAAAKTLS